MSAAYERRQFAHSSHKFVPEKMSCRVAGFEGRMSHMIGPEPPGNAARRLMGERE